MSSLKEECLLNCICERADSVIICNDCRKVSFGRVRRECSQHRNISFLYDFSICPQCRRSSNIKELDISKEVAHKIFENFIN
uniref:Uncharacterized protein n=1 Tax=Megaselia scalaris TaxID=36166 RepID=T1GBG0_MEGSC